MRSILYGLVLGQLLPAGCTGAPGTRLHPHHRPVDTTQTLSTIAIGSCARQDRPQPVWDTICRMHPDLFLFMGDNIYADTTDMATMRAKYQMLAEQAGYRKLCAACPVLATWDDHDYGMNDAGSEYPQKVEAQRVFCDFFDEPADSARRSRPGVYDSRIIGPAGRRVQVILLDTRYFRSPLKRGPQPDGRPGRYVPDPTPSKTLLGAAQWRWLEDQLRRPAELRIIVSSIQVVSEEHGFEKWMNLPHERDRLCRLLSTTGARGVVIVSGDRHRATLSKLDGCAPYPLYDLTASGLNQGSTLTDEVNRHRIGSDYLEPHFGLITIDWTTPDPRISLQIRTVDGRVTLRHDLTLSELQPTS